MGDNNSGAGRIVRSYPAIFIILNFSHQPAAVFKQQQQPFRPTRSTHAWRTLASQSQLAFRSRGNTAAFRIVQRLHLLEHVCLFE